MLAIIEMDLLAMRKMDGMHNIEMMVDFIEMDLIGRMNPIRIGLLIATKTSILCEFRVESGEQRSGKWWAFII